jgi:hypothetical protein
MALIGVGMLAHGSPSADAVDDLKGKHKNANDIHEAHLREFNNIVIILKTTLLSQTNNIFELYKESELLFLTMQAEGERETMTHQKELLR